MPSTRTFTFSQVVLIVALAMLLVFGGFLIGNSTAADASGGPKTYYACLQKGTLSKVGTRHATCTGHGAKLISWNQVGPAGVAGVGMEYLAGTISTTFGSGSVVFTTPRSDANYTVSLTPSSAYAVCSTSNKTQSGFDVTCGNLSEVVTNVETYVVFQYVQSSMFSKADLNPWSGSVDWMITPNKNP